MNCKPGDLAIIVDPECVQNIGKIVLCVRLHSSETHDLDGWGFNESCGPRWVVDQPLSGRLGDGTPCPMYTIPDESLRPIRDNDGEDEMLRIAGNPREVETQ
jgi:hypothetical protein